MFILSSISSGLEFLCIYHISMYENSELNVILKIKFLGKTFSN